MDSEDRDALLEMEGSRGYALLVGRINKEIERSRDQMELGSAPKRLRGYISALRMVLNLPNILKNEE